MIIKFRGEQVAPLYCFGHLVGLICQKVGLSKSFCLGPLLYERYYVTLQRQFDKWQR